MRRVVVTGLGMVTPLACGVEETWSRLLAGQSGAGPITRFDASNVVTQYACEIPLGDGSNGTFNADDWMEPKDRRKVDDFILYGMAAAVRALVAMTLGGLAFVCRGLRVSFLRRGVATGLLREGDGRRQEAHEREDREVAP